eukprot:TRINITY_DN32522_c1_g1_i1.p1 TRINITY_DN32522_c1_g1~~TRINITY_DN32522_c1_g1_i1.p1  ORF type:complete len:322 (-),score=40.81 TRINITY_DN32522_c1_g1_i1:126-1091(-)
MAPSPCADYVWRGRAAEEILNSRDRNNQYQDPDFVRRPRIKVILPGGTTSVREPSRSQSSKITAAPKLGALPPPEAITRNVELVRVCSAPTLKALKAPAVPSESFSPFASSLGFLQREPPEMEAKRYYIARQEAIKCLRQTYRTCIEGLGLKFREEPVWPRKDTSKDMEAYLSGTPTEGRLHPLRETQDLAALWSAKLPAAKKAPKQIPHARRKEVLADMFSFGRGHSAGPYTIGQIYQEIEADIQHKGPKDVRAISGRLSPAILGTGTTLKRRKLPFAQPWHYQSTPTLTCSTEFGRSMRSTGMESFASTFSSFGHGFGS